jgi:hypothetical protein
MKLLGLSSAVAVATLLTTTFGFRRHRNLVVARHDRRQQ